MEEQDEEHNESIIFKLLLSTVIILGFISFALCITAEFKKSKKDDLKLERGLCYLPESGAFSLSIAALVLLIIAQISGNLLACNTFFPGDVTSRSCKLKKPHLATIFQVSSWMSFGVGIILLSTATSISQTQEFGEGWINGECYIVKDGIFIGSAVLVFITVCSIATTAALNMKERQVEQGRKVHAQLLN